MTLKQIDKRFIYELKFTPNTKIDSIIGSSHKIIAITGHPTMRESIDLITDENFCENFLKAARAFVINIKCRGSLMPLDAHQLTLLNGYKDRPMIFFFESKESGFLIYYREANGKIKFTTKISTILIDEFLNSEFTFELLLRALRSNFCGNFSGIFSDISLNVSPLIDDWRLIDLAVIGNNSLCIRFLQLFENCCESVDNYSIRLLQHAARSCNFDSLLAVFDLNFNQKEISTRINRELLNVKDPSGFNLLMIAVENKNIDAVIFLINLNFFDVNYEINDVTAASLACKNLNSEILLMLLQNDSKYPRNFHKIIKSQELEMFCGKISEIHNAIRIGDKKKAEEVVYNLRLRYFFDTSNKSAAMQAIECRDFKIYEYLLRYNGNISPHEHINYNNLDEASKFAIKILHEKYKNPLYEKCVLDLEKKIKCLNILEINRRKYQFEIRNALNILYDIEIFRPILQIIASSNAEINLDFERNSVQHLDPTELKSTRGYFTNNTIFIGCKDLLDGDLKRLFLATLIHEMTHYVMNFLYNNQCRPFVVNCRREKDFQIVHEMCRKNASKEGIIEAVYGYNESLQYAELIVRPNHIFAHYYDNEEMRKECEKNFPELFEFYRDRIHLDLLAALEWIPSGREEIKNSQIKKKRKFAEIHKDVACAREIESLIQIESEENFENKNFENKKFKFWKIFLTLLGIFVTIFVILFVLMIKAYKSQVIVAEKVVMSACVNATHPWNELLISKDIDEIENLSNILKNQTLKLNEAWRVDNNCNLITLAMEKHENDYDFIEDLVAVAEDVFSNCKGNLKKLLMKSIDEIENLKDSASEKICKYLKVKLNNLLSVKEHSDYLSGHYEAISGSC